MFVDPFFLMRFRADVPVFTVSCTVVTGNDFMGVVVVCLSLSPHSQRAFEFTIEELQNTYLFIFLKKTQVTSIHMTR